MKKELDYLPKRTISRERPVVRDMELCLNTSVAIINSQAPRDQLLEHARNSIAERYHNDTVVSGDMDVPTKTGKYWVIESIRDESLNVSVVASFLKHSLQAAAIQCKVGNNDATTYTFSPKALIGLHIEGEPSQRKIGIPNGISQRPALKKVFESIIAKQS